MRDPGGGGVRDDFHRLAYAKYFARFNVVSMHIAVLKTHGQFAGGRAAI